MQGGRLMPAPFYYAARSLVFCCLPDGRWVLWVCYLSGGCEGCVLSNPVCGRVLHARRGDVVVVIQWRSRTRIGSCYMDRLRTCG